MFTILRDNIDLDSYRLYVRPSQSVRFIHFATIHIDFIADIFSPQQVEFIEALGPGDSCPIKLKGELL